MDWFIEQIDKHNRMKRQEKIVNNLVKGIAIFAIVVFFVLLFS